MSQALYVLSWWLALQLVGVAALPLTLRVFRNLPDAGWGFARPVGLLAAGFVFWEATTFGLLANTWSSIFGTLLVVAAMSWTLAWREVVGLKAFVRRQRVQVISIEALFVAAFLLWVVVRAYNPELAGTEKPMELAFLNGVLRSEHFPALDPWLSGYAISYYYFGYVITAMLSRLAAVPTGVAFNLMLATLFAMTATGAYALGSALYAGARGASASARRTVLTGLLAVVLVLFCSNLEPVIDTLNAHSALPDSWRQYIVDHAAPGAGSMRDMPPPYNSPTLGPTDPPDFIWWWRATRIVSTPGPPGSQRPLDYTIDEFPIFSFIHADMHPHVLALPFAFVALGFALNLLRWPGELSLDRVRREPWIVVPLLVLFGGLGFLNTWDMPTFLFVLALVYGTHRVLSRGALDRQVVRELAYGFPAALLACVAVYLPFFFGLRSQASGIGIVLTHTQALHFFLFWGPFYLVALTFLASQLAATWASAPADDWTRSPAVWAGTLVLAAACGVLGAPAVGFILPLLVAAVALMSRYTLAPLAAAAVAADLPLARSAVRRRRETQPQAGTRIAGASLPLAIPREHLFAIVLTFTGLLLVFGTELVYVRDLFGDRMNTVFKLYYQAWPMLALAAAYAVPLMVGRMRALVGALRVGATAWAVALGLVFAGTLIYPYAATLSKTHNFAGPATLDGLQFWSRIQPDDAAAIGWLQQNVGGAPVIVEATGGSYQQEFGRVSSMTGLPTILGWAFHEQQWRGSFDEQARRKPDIDTIYTSTDQRQVLSLLDKYNATYVFVGTSERQAYPQANFDRFAQFMDPVFKRGQVTIYRVRGKAG